MWKLYALLAAVFAAATAILAKIGVKDVNSNLATAIRTAVTLVMISGIVIAQGNINQVKTLTKSNLLFLILSGIATGLSWMFYFRALQEGDASKVAPIDKLSVAFVILFSIIFLGESADPKVLLGGALIIAGSLVIML